MFELPWKKKKRLEAEQKQKQYEEDLKFFEEKKNQYLWLEEEYKSWKEDGYDPIDGLIYYCEYVRSIESLADFIKKCKVITESKSVFWDPRAVEFFTEEKYYNKYPLIYAGGVITGWTQHYPELQKLYEQGGEEAVAKWVEEDNNRILVNKIRAEREMLRREESAVTCPYCKSTNVEKITNLDRLGSTAVWGAASSKLGKQWHCKKCGSDF